jgi:hypothetical protein
MKKISVLLIALFPCFFIPISCKTIARTAAKYWTRKQIKEFVSNCETRTSQLLGSENAVKYCDCAVDVVAEKYRNYQDSKTISLNNLIDILNSCK